MKISCLVLIAALAVAPICVSANTDRSSDKDQHKQTYAREDTGVVSGLRRKLLNENHVPTESRIVGGEDAAIGDYPFFVDWEQCGASLIHKDIILSAAHCYGVSTNQVVIGSSRRNGFSGRGVSRTVLDREKHPLYDDSTVNYDYLVMKLNAPVDLKPVELNDDMDSPLNNEALTVIGYGATSEGGSGTNVLQEATVNYIPTSTCNVNYSGEINDATMMCGGVGGGIDSCQGDSGGPIFIESGADTFKQVGIVSWGYGCARPEYPGVYSRVSGEVDWIKSKICQLSDFPPDYCDNLGGGGGGGGGEGEGEGDVQVRFDITYDAYPTETGWSLKSGQTTLISKKVGSLSTPGFVSETFGLNPGAHTFQIDDSFSDGICCSYGQGKYAIYAERSNGDVLLASSDGTFGGSEIKEFTVPAAEDDRPNPTDSPGGATPSPVEVPTPRPMTAQTPSPVEAPTLSPVRQPTDGPISAPTPRPVTTPSPVESNFCTDTDQEFFVNDSVGEQNCIWLGENQFYFSYLCKFVDVAAACKVTCDACQYFEPRSAL